MKDVLFGYVIYDTVTDTYLQEDAIRYGDIQGAGILTTEYEIFIGSGMLLTNEVLVEVIREQQNTKRIDCAPIARTSIFNQ